MVRRSRGCRPEDPFYYYNIPSMTGVVLPVAPFWRKRGPNPVTGRS